MKTKLWLFFIAFGLIFSACEKDDDFRGGPPDHANAGGRGLVETFTDEAVCEIQLENGIVQTDLIAGQTEKVGTVTVEVGGGYVSVTYETDPGWILTETHLHIAGELVGIPVNNPGNPMVGLFEYGSDDLFTSKYTVQINKDYIPGTDDDDWDGCYYVAAHAVVEGVADADNLYAFADLLPETAKIEIDNPRDVIKSYFNVTVSEGDILNGVWPGWCTELGVQIKPGDLYDAYVYSSYGDVPGYDPELLMKVNWILNHKSVVLDDQGDPVYYTKGDVQIAIWTLLLGLNEFDYDALDETEPPNPFITIGDYHEDRINKILDDVSVVDEFYPECGGVIAIIFKHAFQDLLIEYPVRCGEETAWGEGCRFVDPGNWAMYFKVCPEDEDTE